MSVQPKYNTKYSITIAIAVLDKRIEVLHWDAIGGQIASWYAYNTIAELEMEREELVLKLEEL